MSASTPDEGSDPASDPDAATALTSSVLNLERQLTSLRTANGVGGSTPIAASHADGDETRHLRAERPSQTARIAELARAIETATRDATSADRYWKLQLEFQRARIAMIRAMATATSGIGRLRAESAELDREVRRVQSMNYGLRASLLASERLTKELQNQIAGEGERRDQVQQTSSAIIVQQDRLENRTLHERNAIFRRAALARFLVDGPTPQQLEDARFIESNLFDAKFYCSQAARLGLSSVERPALHYIMVGADLGFNPHPLFDTIWYLCANADTTGQTVNPLVHFLRRGVAEGRDPHPLFDTAWYLENAKGVGEGAIPVLDFLSRAPANRPDPNPFFNVRWYLERYPDVAQSGICPLQHFIDVGAAENRDPHPSFDIHWYRQRYSAELNDCRNPLEHFLEWRQRGDVHPNARAAACAGKQCTILVVAHNADARMFGAERSLLDVLRVLDGNRFRVILALPDPAISYVERCRHLVDQVFFYERAWWQAGRPSKEALVKLFEGVIRRAQVSVVYGNTIMLREPFEAARRMSVPSICHVRELIDQDQALSDSIGLPQLEILTEVRRRADFFVANSEATRRLIGSRESTALIYNAVDVEAYDIPIKPASDGSLSVGMLSSNIWKKGIADVFELALAAEEACLPLRFKLFGPISDQIRELQDSALRQGRAANIELMGYEENGAQAMGELNVVLNFSHFAESFGRSVAEAMAARRVPIVYRHGALPELVTHEQTGFIIPYKKPLEALPWLRRLCEDPALLHRMGEKAREEALDRFSMSALGAGINAVFEKVGVREGSVKAEPFQPINESLQRASAGLPCRATAKAKGEGGLARATSAEPGVSVIVPNYNYAAYLEARFQSILSQTLKPREVIFLDDSSTDDSVAIACRILENCDVPYQILVNESNQGVYRQWLKGISLASSDWLWIAEADDHSNPDFLEKLVGHIQNGVNIVYSQSQRIDETGHVSEANNLGHTNDIDRLRWRTNYVATGVREVTEALAYRNTIPNVSAAILRRSALEGIESVLDGFRFCGDWVMYAHLLRKGKIAYEASSLNRFRRHSQSVTRRNARSMGYLQELARVRLFLAEHFPILARHMSRMNEFLDKDYRIEGVARNSTATEIAPLLAKAQKRISSRKRVAFITTNNGSHDGGSEMLWRESVEKLRAEGHDVLVLIKKWDPRPAFFNHFETIGARFLFKEENGFEELLGARPDLTIVSIGDQDEGTEFYPELSARLFPYVIINQLTKEPEVWPIRAGKTRAVSDGYGAARKVFFTCQNNRRVMEERLGRRIPNADIHFNPYHVDRNSVPAWPGQSNGFEIAVPSKVLFIHKGQDILLEVARDPQWKARPVRFNFFGVGPDEEKLKTLARNHGVENFKFHGRVDDIGLIWQENHALLMPSRMEGLPIMLVSAMLSARVPILTDVGGHAELATDGTAGFIAKGKDAPALAEAMERAWCARSKWREIGQAARRRVLEFLPEDPVADFVRRVLALC